MRKEMIFRILHVVLLVCIVIEGCGSAFGIREVGGWHWLAAVFFVCILTIMNYGRARERLICSMILTVCVVILAIFNGVLQTGDFLVSYAEWLIGKEGWNQEWIRGYELIQTMIITACCYSFQILAEKYAVLCDISAAGLLIGMIAYMVLKREVSHFGVVMALGYIAICYIERTQRNWEKKKKRDRREYVLWILPFCAAYMVLMYLMPFPAKPYDWKFVKDAYRNIKEDITIWQEERKRNGQEDFGTAKAGFSEDGRLMSGFVGNDQKLLKLQFRSLGQWRRSFLLILIRRIRENCRIPSVIRRIFWTTFSWRAKRVTALTLQLLLCLWQGRKGYWQDMWRASVYLLPRIKR